MSRESFIYDGYHVRSDGEGLTCLKPVTMIKNLSAEELRNTCPTDLIARLTEIPAGPSPGLIGQERASRALQLGLGIKAEGFNVFVAGEQGTGKLQAVRSFLEETAKREPVPEDWCYVNNFEDPYQPCRLSLPPGRGAELRKDMKKLVQEALQSLLKAFDSEEYVSRRRAIGDKYDQLQASLNNSLQERASKEAFQIKQTPWDIYTMPLKNGEPMTDKDFDALSDEEKHRIQEKQQGFSEEIKNLLQETRRLEKEAGRELAKLESEVAGFAITTLVAEMEERYADRQEIVRYLMAVKQDILDNLAEFLLSHKPQAVGTPPVKSEFLRRYEVNVMIDNAHLKSAPIIIENNPTYNNLVGRVEKESVMGTLVTDFTMIRKGSLHTANGGYLIIRAEELFRNLFSWDALKRCIRNHQVMIEEATDQLGYLTTKSLKPEPIPLQVKVILVGAPMYYHLLYAYDNDFRVLFKVKADFDSEMERTEANTAEYIRFTKGIAEKEKLGSPDTAALAKIVEYGSRLAEDKEKLSTRFDAIADVVREAGHYAAGEGSQVITEKHIRESIERKTNRSNLIQEKINEMIGQRQILIDVNGTREGQVNGLSVISLGDISFGRPTRITCTVNPGKTGVIAIEREAELSGPIHTKGVMILSGFLAERYFQDKPVSLSARLVFEQSYSEVEGDSASSTELYALLSNLANLPVRQGIAVTGSVNQKGQVQAIGGVNEKIEGYYELCKLLGLNGEQGVIIPSSNMRNLMLKEEVAEAVSSGKFHVWSVDNIDEGIELLTGVRAGNIADEGSVNYLVARTLDEYAKKMLENGEMEPDGKMNNMGKWVSDIV